MRICAGCAEPNPDHASFCGACGSRFDEDRVADERRIVTIVFCDLSGSTSLGERLDAERFRATLRAYHNVLRRALERHGGHVEKFVGDAVMAEFGLPRSHEDDAFRAVKAAVEMRRDIAELGLRVRIGVNTGEVVAGGGETLVTGDAVNVAARLEQAAAPGEILLGLETVRLLRGAVRVEQLMIEARGKRDLVPAGRLLWVDLDASAPSRRGDGPLVDRERELRLLEQSLERAAAERSCGLVTILGAAGVGKSRLTVEFTGRAGVRVVRGRCLSYGDGITFWPLMEILVGLGDNAAALRSSLDSEALSSPQQLFRRVRLQLEEAARDRPLIVVVEDLHWAEPTLLDLLDNVAELTRDAALLLLCIARPELLDERPGWGGGKLNATTMLLEPLAADDTARLIQQLAGPNEIGEPDVRRVMQTAEGNPLFVEELVSLLREDGASSMPPTIHAVLQARLDRLAPPARELVGLAAVEGTEFHRSALRELTGRNGAGLDADLEQLVRKDLIRPTAPKIADDDAYRFRHVFIRDVAYGSLAKERRIELHRRLARWMNVHAEAIAESDELVGHHLEQAARYARDLGTPDPQLECEAAERLADGGLRASTRVDFPAAARLLERSLELLPQDHERRAPLLLEHGMCLEHLGLLTDSDTQLGRALATATRQGDELTALRARVALRRVGVHTRPQEVSYRSAAQEAEEAARRMARLEDELGQGEAWMLVADFRYWQGELGASIDAYRQAIDHARRAGNARLVAGSVGGVAFAMVEGPRSVSEGLDAVSDLSGLSDDPLTALRLVCVRGTLIALAGDLDEGWRLVEHSGDLAKRLGAELVGVRLVSECLYLIAVVAGRRTDAERSLVDAVRFFEEGGGQGFLSTRAAYLAHVLFEQNRFDEAAQLTARYAALGTADDYANQVEWRLAAAKLATRDGDATRAQILAKEAVEMMRPTDSLIQKPRALEDMAVVMELSGLPGEAATARAEAREMYQRKGCQLALARMSRELTP